MKLFNKIIAKVKKEEESKILTSLKASKNTNGFPGGSIVEGKYAVYMSS